VTTLLMGALDENYQRLTPGRTCDLHDWYADALGGTLGTTLTYLYAKRRRLS
jgi:VanZ family protein